LVLNSQSLLLLASLPLLYLLALLPLLALLLLLPLLLLLLLLPLLLRRLPCCSVRPGVMGLLSLSAPI
jgi:hypothetical protein